MSRYKVHLRGENFLLNLDGDHGKFGFSTARVITADNQEEAVRIAIIRVHQELNQSSNVIKDVPDTPRIILDRVEKLKFFHFIKKKESCGFNFISEDK